MPSSVRMPLSDPWICANPNTGSPLLPPASPPPSAPVVSAPSVTAASACTLLDVGSASRISRVSTFCDRTLVMSTTGLDPVTVIVSSTPPGRRSALTVAVNPVFSSSPSRRTVLKPVRVKLTA